MVNEANSKFEIRNPKQIQMTKAQNSKQEQQLGSSRERAVLGIRILDFEFVSNFDIRISDF
jgi:hypothetical protein